MDMNINKGIYVLVDVRAELASPKFTNILPRAPLANP